MGTVSRHPSSRTRGPIQAGVELARILVVIYPGGYHHQFLCIQTGNHGADPPVGHCRVLSFHPPSEGAGLSIPTRGGTGEGEPSSGGGLGDRGSSRTHLEMKH